MSDARCPVCKSGQIGTRFVAANGYPIVACRACDQLFTDASTAPQARELYPAFNQTNGSAMGAVRSMFALFLRRRLDLVTQVRPTGRLLDFGAGSGAFARFAASRGYEVVGLEPFSLGQTESSGNLTLVRERLEDAVTHLGKFDVITSWHVLEHLENPVETLRLLRTLLKDDGVFVLSVPNYDSLQSKAFGGAWFHLDAPRHLLHFTQATFDACLERAGLVRERDWPFQLEYGISGWVQSGLNKVLSHHNYLYEVVKDRGALAGTSLLENVGNSVASLALGAPLGLLSVPIEAAAARGNRAAALTVCARPRQ